MISNPHRTARHARWGIACFWHLLFALLVSPALAQTAGTGTISGRIINEATGEYLRNANVTVAGTALTTTAEAGGHYRLSGVPAGPATVTVTYAGLDPKDVPVTVPAGQTVTQDVALTSASYGVADGSVVKLDAFRVSTTREGNARAIMVQRAAPNLTKVISADALGSVSEGNVGEFLKLMPGVVMDYVEADTRAMRVRGLNPKYANVLVDGFQPASAGSSNIGTGRAFEFEQLSISSVETVELTKAPTPDVPSSVAGTVNLNSKSAFDRKGRHFDYRVALSANSYYAEWNETPGWNNESHRKILPNFNFEYSDDTLAGGRLGLVVGVNSSHTIAAQKHIWFFGTTDNATALPYINRIWYQDGPKPTERGNYNLRLDYRLGDNTTVFARVDYSTYDARFYNRTFNLRIPAVTRNGAGQITAGRLDGGSWTDQTVVGGRVSIDSNQFMTKEGNTAIFTTGVNHRVGDLTADIGLHYSRARNWYDNRAEGHFTDFSSSINNVGWRMTRSSAGDTGLNFQQLSGADWRDVANYRFDAGSIGWHERFSKDQQWAARADFVYDLKRSSLPQTLKFGARSNLMVRDVYRAGLLTANPVGADGVFGTADDPRPADFLDDEYVTDFDFGGTFNAVRALSPWKLHDHYRANPGQWALVGNHDQARLRGNWDFKETTHAAYASDTFHLGKWDLSPGIRYETTKSDGRGVGTAGPVADRPLAAGTSYDAWLKYLHASYNLSRDVRLRASYHDAITRADISNLIPGVSGFSDVGTGTITATNPDLKPERSRTLNGSIEYYFEPAGVLSASVFYTRLKDRQFNSPVVLGPGGYPGIPNTAGFTLNTPVNLARSTYYAGVEIDYSQQLSFLPGALKGLGVFANHTRLKFDDWAFNLGSAKVITNGGLSYNHGRFSGRVNLNWVGKLLQNPSRNYNPVTGVWTYAANPGVEIYQKDRLVTDLNVEFKLNSRVSLFLDGRNILNEPSVYTYYGHEDNFERILRTGGIWMLGVKGRF